MVITRKESNLDPSLPDKYLRHSQIIGCTANLLLCPVPQAKCSARASLLFRSLKSIQISGTDMYFMENWPEIRASPPTPFLGNARKQHQISCEVFLQCLLHTERRVSAHEPQDLRTEFLANLATSRLGMGRGA